MKASVLLCCDSGNVQFLPTFYNSLLAQKEPVYEVIIITNLEDLPMLSEIKEVFKNATFEVSFVSNKSNFNFQKYNSAFQKFSGDYVLFAQAQHPFTPLKVEQFSRYFNEDPYIRYAFTNVEIIDGTNQIIILDYFGLSGFYERWDIFKSLPNVMAKQIGFVNDFQIGITAKTVKKFQEFLATHNFEYHMRFEDFLSTFIGVRYEDTIKEIPYVLTQMRWSVAQIEELRITRRNLNLSSKAQLLWLEELEELIKILDKDHKVLNFIDAAKTFHLRRAQKQEKKSFSIFSTLGNFLVGNYGKYSFEPVNLLKQDLKN